MKKFLKKYILHKQKGVLWLLVYMQVHYFVLSVHFAEAGLGAGLAVSKLKDIFMDVVWMAALVSIPGLMLWLATGLFDISLDWSVLQFTQKTKDLIPVIKQFWTLIRDITNIAIIGTFVYIAISKILGIADDDRFKKMIINLLLVAIFINFSYYLTALVIDLSNWVSVQIYNAAMPATTHSFSEIIVYNSGGVEWTSGAWDSILKFLKGTVTGHGLVNFIYIFTSLVMTTFVAIMFFRMAFMFIARGISIFFLLATSSAAFAFMLIPGLHKYWEQWKDSLLYNAIFAPILILILVVMTNVLAKFHESIQAIRGVENTSNVDDGGIILMLVFMALSAAVIWGALRIANFMADKAANASGLGKTLNSWLNTVQGHALKHAGWAGHQLGHYAFGSALLKPYDWMNTLGDKAHAKGWARTGAALYKTRDFVKNRAKKTKLDPRNSRLVKGMVSAAGIKMAKSTSKDIATAIAEREKRRAEIAKQGAGAIRSEAEKARMQAGITKSDKELKQQEKILEKQIKSTEQLAENISSMRTASQAGDASPQAIMKVTQDNVAKLKQNIKKAREAKDDTLVQQQESLLKQQQAKIEAIQEFINTRDNRISGQAKSDLEQLDRKYDEEVNRIKNDKSLDKNQKDSRLADLRQDYLHRTNSILQTADPDTATMHSNMLHVSADADRSLERAEQDLEDYHSHLTTLKQATRDDLAKSDEIRQSSARSMEKIGAWAAKDSVAKRSVASQEDITKLTELRSIINDLRQTIEENQFKYKQALRSGDTDRAELIKRSIDKLTQHLDDTIAVRNKVQNRLVDAETTYKQNLQALERQRMLLNAKLRRLENKPHPTQDDLDNMKSTRKELGALNNNIQTLTDKLNNLSKFVSKEKQNLGKSKAETEEEKKTKEFAKRMYKLFEEQQKKDKDKNKDNEENDNE